MTDKSKFTILNVDDDDASRYAISHILRQAGFEVLEAADGAEALRLVKQNPDLVILDVNLPDINGFEVCRRIRADPATSLMPVLMLSATYRDDQSRVRGLDSGADGYLTQPVEPQVLISTVKALLRIRQAEAELQAAAREWRTTFDAIGDAVCLLDGEGMILRCNQAMTNLLGKPFDEIIGRTCWELVHGTSEPIAGCPVVRMMETHRRETLVLPMGDHWIEVTADPLLDEAGNLIGSVHIMADITERQQAEEALRESEERFRRLYERAPLGYQSLDAEGCFIDVNQAWLDLLGYSRDQVIGRWFGDFLAPQELDSFKERFLRFKATGEVHVDVEMVQCAGSTIIVHIDGRIGQDKHGQFKQTHCILHAITERKRAEEALRETNTRLQTLVQAIPDIVYFKDAQGRNLVANRAFEELVGLKQAEIVGKTDKQLLPPELAEYCRQSDEEVMRSNKPLRFEEQSIGEDGEKISFETIKAPLFDDQGNAVGLVGVSRDITERKRTEEELIRLSSVVKTSGDIIGIIDMKGKIVDVNEAALKMYGTDDKGDLAGKHIFHFIAPEQRDRALAGMEAVLERGHDRSRGYDLVTKDGSRVPVEVSAAAMEGPDGKPMGLAIISRDITEQLQAEEALRESEERFARAFRSSPVGMLVIRLSDGKIVDINDSYLATIGYQRDDIIGKASVDIGLAVDLEDREKSLTALRQRQALRNRELKFLKKSGELGVALMSAEAVQFGTEPHGVIVLNDITERKRAEEALRERLKELTCLYAVHRKMQEDLSTDELCRRVVEHLVSAMEFPEITVPVIELDGKRFTSEGYSEGLSHGLHAEIRVERKPRGHLWVYYAEDRPFVIPEEQNLVNGVAEALGVWLEHKQAEEALQESEERYRQLVELSPDTIAVHSEGKTTFVNTAGARLLGAASPEQLVGKPIVDFVHPEYRDIVKERIGWISQEGKEAPVIEEKLIRLDGTIIDVEVASIPFTYQGKPAVQAIIRDITERKRAEEERKRLLAELEAKNRELESFVYTVSHDLKAPLVSLHGFSSTLQKEFYHQLNDEGRHYLERIQANAAHMDTLIMDLLELSRIGRVVGPIEEMDVAALLREIQEELAVKLEEAGVEFVVQEPLPTIRADRGRIRQVFVNLIDNAVKFKSEERPLRIEVGCQEERGFYRFHVADNGIGIASQYQEQIFAPFQQLDTKTEGVGMGLALVKKIVEHHGGRVWVESEAEKGATFYFTIPVRNLAKVRD